MKFLKSGHVSESSIQKALFEWIKYNHFLKDKTFHIANGTLNGRHGKELKLMGVLPGVSDIFMMKATHGYHGMFLELKSAEGKLSKQQTAFIANAEEEGYFTAVTNNLDEALEIVTWYGLSASEGCPQCGCKCKESKS